MLRLTGPGETVIFDIADHLSPDPASDCNLGGMEAMCGEASVSGVLQAGDYVLEARVYGSAASWPASPGLHDGYASGAYSVEPSLLVGPGVPALSPLATGLLARLFLLPGLVLRR